VSFIIRRHEGNSFIAETRTELDYPRRSRTINRSNCQLYKIGDLVALIPSQLSLSEVS
jgi:hypothetical protein